MVWVPRAAIGWQNTRSLSAHASGGAAVCALRWFWRCSRNGVPCRVLVLDSGTPSALYSALNTAGVLRAYVQGQTTWLRMAGQLTWLTGLGGFRHTFRYLAPVVDRACQ